jgi:hypothetical protein
MLAKCPLMMWNRQNTPSITPPTPKKSTKGDPDEGVEVLVVPRRQVEQVPRHREPGP